MNGWWDRGTGIAVAQHLVLVGFLLFGLASGGDGKLEGDGVGGGSQLMELSLGGPGMPVSKPARAAQATQPPPAARPPAAQTPTTRPRPDEATAVSPRKRRVEAKPRPKKETPRREVAQRAPVPRAEEKRTVDTQPTQTTSTTTAPESSHEGDSAVANTAHAGVPGTGTTPGSGGPEKGMAYGTGGGTGGGSTAHAGTGGEGLGGTGAGTGGYDRGPRAVYTPRPPYPREALHKGAEGVVMVRLLLDPSGRVVQSRIAGGDMADIFAETTLETVERWRFKPCGRQGRNVSCEVEIPVEFRIDR
ncbi:energy transducer TonB [Nitratidesulfovibrio vulgaris]|uniref:TonB domain protein n=1 Tax=Nitratidesulfovibrio vulgaris (strain ATCC 29579 / DSM 644 / CCUG 34227 / NCIMB 8303 / VKM B-1760 / Hildenborough) TaxID=882 RepID=Q729G1_NITV2|nr:energy transducer TonB [Nitratidesulfovibrio vulgaris]AAS96863.1 TonB domain protein [Nitratidesulfovibrio vulgaris str. Hildenborough]ADP87356.1 TonB family protein [Nitratidesulfovibrio vulgaris RCH1]